MRNQSTRKGIASPVLKCRNSSSPVHRPVRITMGQYSSRARFRSSGARKSSTCSRRRFLHSGETQEPQAGGIDELRPAVQAGEADEVGRSLDQRKKAPLVRLRLPSLQCDSRIICADPEEESLRFGGKVGPARPRNENCVAAKADRGGGNAKRSVPEWIGIVSVCSAVRTGNCLRTAALNCARRAGASLCRHA